MGADSTVDSTDDFEQHLEDLLADAEQTASELRAELRELRSARCKSEEARQREEINRLEEHLAQTHVNWRQVRDFLIQAVREVRSEKEA